MFLKRVTILLNEDDATYKEDAAFVEGWFKKRKNDLSYNSGDEGYNEVHMWDIECSEEIAAEIPKRILAGTDWSHSKVGDE